MDPELLTLDILPLVVGAIKSYKSLKKRLNVYRRYSREMHRMRQRLDLERMLFLNETRILVLTAVDDHLLVTQMFDDPENPHWSSKKAEADLRKVLADSYREYHDTISSITETIREIQTELDCFKVVESEWRDDEPLKETIYRIRERVKIPWNKTKVGESLEDLKQFNGYLQRLGEQMREMKKITAEKAVVEGLKGPIPQERTVYQGTGRRSLELGASNPSYEDYKVIVGASDGLLAHSSCSSDSGIDDDQASLSDKTAGLPDQASLSDKTAGLPNLRNHVIPEEGPLDKFTDSGYASNTIQQSRLQQPSTKNSIIDDDAETIYSHATSLTPSDDHKYISDMTDDLLEIAGHGLTEESFASTARLLPRLLEAAAVKVGMDTSDPRNLKVMYFVHKYRKRIVEEFEERLHSQTKETVNSIPLDEKIFQWLDRTSESPEEVEESARSFSSSSDVSSDDDRIATDARIEASEINAPDEYTTIWGTSHGRNWLRATLQQSLKLTIPVDKEAYWEFQRIILGSFPQRRYISLKASPEPYIARFDMDWNPWDFHVNEDYDESLQEVLARAVTLTGSEGCNQVLTSLDYMRQTWPQTGQSLVEILQYALNHNPNTIHTFSLIDGTHLAVQHRHNSLSVQVKGSKFSIVEVGEQLGWISTALRSSSHDDGIAVFRPSIQYRGALDSLQKNKEMVHHTDKCTGFSITAKQTDHIPPGSEISGTCWMSLFRNPVLVQGFPVLKRGEPEIGIEMPPPVMAKLIQASHITLFGETFFIKGYSALAIAVRKKGHYVIWHHIHQPDGNYISYTDAKAMLKPSDGLETITKVDIMTCRHILGWCDEAANYTGTDKSNLDIDKSGGSVRKVDTKPITMDRMGFGFAPPHTPISFNVSCAVGRKERPPHIPWGSVYEKRLQTIGRRRVLLYDTGDCIGWVVDGASALLHLVRAQLKHDAEAYRQIGLFQFDSRQLEEAPESVAYAGHIASMSVLTNRKNRELPIGGAVVEHWEETTKKTSKAADSAPAAEVDVAQKTKEVPICFQQAVEDMYNKLEMIFDHEAQRTATDGLSLPKRKRLQGYHFSDIYQCDGALHVQQARHKHKGAKLVESLGALTLFGNGFGKLIRAAKPDNICSGCFFEADVPRGQHLFVASGQELRAILHEDRDRQVACWDQMCKTHWDQSNQRFECSCEKVQEREKHSIFRRPKARHLTQPHSLQSERAAAIFSYDSVKWRDMLLDGQLAEQDHLHPAEQESQESAGSGLLVQSTSGRSESFYSTTDLADSSMHSTTTPMAISDESPPTSYNPPNSASDQPDKRANHNSQSHPSQ